MELQQYELQQMMDQAAEFGATRALSRLHNPKLPTKISEREARGLLTDKGISSAMLDTWVNLGMINFHRTGSSKNSKKQFSRVELEILVTNFKKTGR